MAPVGRRHENVDESSQVSAVHVFLSPSMFLVLLFTVRFAFGMGTEQ